MDRRRPGGNPLGTKRNENDTLTVLSGMEDSQEAGGFDYQGKVSLLRHALSLKNTLINLQVGQDELLVKPQELTKTTDGEMLLKASILPLGESRLIPVGKIFLIRMGYTCLTL